MSTTSPSADSTQSTSSSVSSFRSSLTFLMLPLQYVTCPGATNRVPPSRTHARICSSVKPITTAGGAGPASVSSFSAHSLACQPSFT